MDNTNKNLISKPTIDTSLLECSICLNILAEPVSVPCGHSFCRTCLVTALQRAQKKCPLCRAVCVIDAAVQNENVHLAAILKTCFPSQYNERLKEVEELKKQWKKTLPIFFFNDTLFPGYVLRLHLFEPRYKLMIKRALEGNRCFAYLPNFSSYTPSIGDVGLVAHVTECQFLHDGRALLEATITSRFKISDHWKEDGTNNLYYCQYEEFPDEKEEDTEGVKKLFEEALKNVDKFRALIESLDPIRQFTLKQAIGAFPPSGASAETVCWWLIITVTKVFNGIEDEERYKLLTSASLKWRLQKINEHINRILS